MLLDNIKVAIRIRPFTNRELEISDITTLLVLDKETVSTIPPIEAGIRQNQKTYNFNWVFDRMISQKEIFETTLEYQVLSVLDGINFTIMSYGASGSGKSHTLVKYAEDYGLLIRSINKIFQTIQNKKRQIAIKFSYLEISQEQLYDLLNNMNTNLDIRDDQDKGVVIHGIKEMEIASTQELIQLIQIAKKQKSLKQHELLIFSLYIQDHPDGKLVVSKLIFADLGWVERGAQKKKNISLQVLNNCISLLNEAKKKNTQTFIPYRNSKLTRLLKESLGGNSKTLMISCVSPAILGYEDTIQTLEYSQMATTITNQTSIKVFQDNEQQLIMEQTNHDLVNQNEELKKQLNKQSQKQNEVIQMQQIEKNIIQHFNRESSIQEDIFKMQYEAEQMKQGIKDKQQLLDKIDLSERKKYNQLRDEIENDQEKVELQENEIKKLQKQTNDFTIQRKALQDNIKQNSLVDVDKLYLTNLIEKFILKLQLQEIKAKESIYQLHQQEQEKLLSLQNNQITLRDRIIEEQRKQITQNFKLNSTKRYTKSDGSSQLITTSKSKFKLNPILPKVSDIQQGQEPYLYRQSSSRQTPQLQTPKKKSKSRSKSKSRDKFKTKIPNKNVIDNLSTPQIHRYNALDRASPSKLIDSKSMVALPLIQSNRSVTKFVYDSKSGGYKFLEEQSIFPQQVQKQQQKQIPIEQDKSFLINSSRGSSVQKNHIKQGLLLPGKVNESLYVKGFINKEIEMKMKLHQLNLKMKKAPQKK
ncbi:unnamed protein product (macronuclear) [Paramecium tetraurelia]|uniref:Kinesin motor domain-containing protein n=1 Tax=Paramecium tetraurelia TaxID=5888 RepID=A0EHP9_PARTE|nr:uncharacterized protein GSPATT00027166001 [Paramecium tetraurelia]CAK94840.1 unnamed protein product [Paramecium tetraurelia]|eukprot:XP_001462213.1 hypothetical protein (macronuclear) [Paramecium tetraurelia strain d4-2]